MFALDSELKRPCIPHPPLNALLFLLAETQAQVLGKTPYLKKVIWQAASLEIFIPSHLAVFAEVFFIE